MPMFDTFKVIPWSEAIEAAPYLPSADPVLTFEEMAEAHAALRRDGGRILIEGKPQPAPAPNRPDEHWWIRTDEGMPLEPACVTFEGDAPARVQRLGDDSWGGTPVEDFRWTHTDEAGTTTVHSRLELVERILPPGRVAEVITLLEEAWAQQSASGPEVALAGAIALLRGEPAEEDRTAAPNA